MAEQPTPAPQKQLLLQKIYVKDLSFESPKAPMVFTQNVSPQTQLNVRSSAQQVAPDTQEVTLTITVVEPPFCVEGAAPGGMAMISPRVTV